MPGKLCNGSIEEAAKPFKDSKAYCEGMAHRASNTAANAPITDNPHLAGTEVADAWDAGWTAANGETGTISDAAAGCCALRGATIQL